MKILDKYIIKQILYSIFIVLGILVVVVGCNSGVHDGQTYPGYNGEQYDPTI